MLIEFTVDYEFEDENDETVLKAEEYLSHLFNSKVEVNVPASYTWQSYTNPFPTYCDMDEEDIPF